MVLTFETGNFVGEILKCNNFNESLKWHRPSQFKKSTKAVDKRTTLKNTG